MPLVPVPGACAAVAGLSVSGFRASEYVFLGFLPRTGKARKQLVAEAAAEARAVVLYEAPHRLLATLGDLAAAGAAERDILCARELTKRHEELHRGTVAAAAAHYAESAAGARPRARRVHARARADRRRGDGAARRRGARVAAGARRRDGRRALAAGESVSRVAKEVAAELDLAKKEVYTTALRLKEELDGEAGGRIRFHSQFLTSGLQLYRSSHLSSRHYQHQPGGR